jgi:deoxyadenosine/deoxycytidine kinase
MLMAAYGRAKFMNKNSSIFVLEGAAFAGKTTLINYLQKNYCKEIVVIPEAGEYVGGDENFPNTPFKTYKEGQASTYFFIEIEKRRCEDAKTAHKNTELPVLMDRATPISSLIFYSLLAYVDSQSADFFDKIYQHALQAFQAQIEAGNIFIPEKLIYLRPKDRPTFEKRLNRGTKNGVFANWESFQFLDKKYRDLIDFHYNGKINSLILDSENTNDNLNNIAEETLNFIKNNRQSKHMRNIFSNFLGEGRGLNSVIDADEESQFSAIRNQSKRLMNLAKKSP